MLKSKTSKLRQCVAARWDDHRDPDERLPPVSADCPMTFTPLAAEPVVCAILLIIAVVIPCFVSIVYLS